MNRIFIQRLYQDVRFWTTFIISMINDTKGSFASNYCLYKSNRVGYQTTCQNKDKKDKADNAEVVFLDDPAYFH